MQIKYTYDLHEAQSPVSKANEEMMLGEQWTISKSSLMANLTKLTLM